MGIRNPVETANAYENVKKRDKLHCGCNHREAGEGGGGGGGASLSMPDHNNITLLRSYLVCTVTFDIRTRPHI